MEVAVYQTAKHGNDCSGDSYFYIETDDGFICALADGLGSGELAKASSETVIQVVQKKIDEPLDSLIDLCNEALSGKNMRGCVLSILRIDYQHCRYSYASIGNIGVVVVNEDGSKKRNIPNPGYLSGIKRDVNIHRGALEDGAVFFMFSDGVNERQLTKEFYSQKSMQSTINWFTLQQQKNSHDDTTLIAMKYHA